MGEKRIYEVWYVERLEARVAELEGALNRIATGNGTQRDIGIAVNALGRDECKHEWLHDRSPLTNKPDKCVLCGMPREQAGERDGN